MSTKILIAADIVPTDTNKDKFANGDVEYLIGKNLKERFHDAAFIAMNLEVPLVDMESPIRKCGPCLIAPTNSINAIKKINPYFFTLANNHILDQGISGLKSTMRILSENGIDYSGVGDDLTGARKPYIKMINGIRVGFYCCAEHEYSIATNDTAGANPYDPLFSFDDVHELKKKCDYLIVLYHGGKEHYRYPSPLLQKVFHKFADVGADLIVAQHTHCIGCREEYKGSTLVYGQGNFLFDHSNNECWETSMLIEVDLEDRSLSFIPLIKMDDKVREAEGDKQTKILNDFNTRSKNIQINGYIDQQYSEFANRMQLEYLFRFSGGFGENIFVRVINKLTSFWFFKFIYSDKYRVVIENVLDCEAHRELAAESLKGKTPNKQ